MRSCAFIGVGVFALLAHSASADDNVIAHAQKLAANKQYETALALLAGDTASGKGSYERRFLRARILSWSGDYKKAQSAFDKLMTDYPVNADIMLAAANLDYFQENFANAERKYRAVLTIAPDYPDASRGIENIQKAYAAEKERAWRLDFSSGTSTFENDALSDWDEQFFRLQYSGRGAAYHAAAQRLRRFGETDIQLSAGVSSLNRTGFTWALGGALTPQASFRPDFSLDGRIGYSFAAGKLGSGAFALGYQYNQFATGDVQLITPETRYYFSAGASITARLVAALKSGEDAQYGWLVDGRLPITGSVFIRGGYAEAPEAIGGIVTTTKSLFGGAGFDLGDDLQMFVGISRDDRENTYIRNNVNVSFTHHR